MRQIILLLISTFATVLYTVKAQNKPFPQNTDYSYGFKPATISSDLVQSEYSRWKSTLVTKCNDNMRITTDNVTQTKVEAIGFGTLLSAYRGDRKTFDGLYNFYKSKCNEYAGGMMAWDVTCDGFNDSGSATDGDIDVAFALVVAYNQWGGNYLNEAKEILKIIKKEVLINCDGTTALAPGYAGGRWGGCGLTDIQYYTPAYFRIFAEITNDTIWGKLANDSYKVLSASANDSTGLVPDWQSAAGTPITTNSKTYYSYDACRVPWRMALDYLWNGNKESKNWCEKISNWAFKIGPENIKDGYNLDGTIYSTDNSNRYHNSAFVGGFAVSSMCNSQEVSDSFAEELTKLNDSYWFNLCTRMLYLFTMSGNYWKPATVFPSTTSVIINAKDNISEIDNDNGQLQMEATIFPDSAFFKILNWSVVNGTGKATIDNSGLLTAISDGVVTVRGTAVDDTTIFSEFSVTISNQTVNVPDNNRSINNVIIYPNPVLGDNIMTISGLKNNCSLEIIDSSGKSVFFCSSVNTDIITYDASGLSNAIYFVHITDNDNNTSILKFIKQE